MAVGAILALAGAAYQGYQAHQQRRKAKNLEKSRFVPPSLLQALSSSRSRASKSVAPGYGRARADIAQTSANNIDEAKKAGASSAQIQQAVANIDRNEKKSVSDLSAANEAYLGGVRGQHENLLLEKGSVEQQNENQYGAAKASLKGAAAQNEFNAITGVAGLGADMIANRNVSNPVTPTVTDSPATPPSLATPMSVSEPGPIQVGISVPNNINPNLRGKPTFSTLSVMTAQQRQQLYGTSDISQILKAF